MKQIFINCEHLETRVAVVENGILEEYKIERNDERQIVGSVYKGRINNLAPSLQAAFIDIGLAKNAFSHYKDLVYYKTMFEERDGKITFAPKPEQNPDNQSDKPETQKGQNNQKSNQGNRNKGNQGNNNQQNRNKGNQQKPKAQSQPKAQPAPAKVEKVVEKQKGLFGKIKSIFSKPEEVVPEPKKPAPKPNQKNGNNNNATANRDRNNGNNNGGNNKNRNKKGGNQRPNHGGRRNNSINMVKAEDIPKLCPEGSDIIVQVEKGPIGTKGAKVTTKVEIPGHYLVLLPNSKTRGVSKRIEDKVERKRLQGILTKLDMPKNMGCICRTAGMGKKDKFFEMDMAMLLMQWEEMKSLINKKSPVCIYEEPSLLDRSLREFLTDDIDEIVVDSTEAYEHVLKATSRLSKEEGGRIKLYRGAEPMFKHYKLKRQVESISGRQVTLPSGGYLCIDETEALIAVDVNSGRSNKGKDHPETILNTNLETVDALARQLRLRNIGGLVVIDFIDMKSKKDQNQVYKNMLTALSKDRARTKIIPISRFGLMELTRQREHESLRDTMYEDCPYCKGKGLVKSATSVSVDVQRKIRSIIKKRKTDLSIRVIVHSSVLNRLREDDKEFLHEMERKLGGALSFRADDSLHIEETKIIDQGSGKEF